VLFLVAVVAALGWWRPVLRDHRPVRRWVWVMPIIMGVAVLGGINYPELAGKGTGFTLMPSSLQPTSSAPSRSSMYRGICVITFRVNGYSRREGGAVVVDTVRPVTLEKRDPSHAGEIGGMS
jgi:uncharacterized protein